MTAMSRPAAALSLLAAMTLTGANVAFGKAVVAAFPIYVFVLFRFAIATVALSLVAAREQGPRLHNKTVRQWRDLVLMSLFGMVGFTVFMFEGLKRTAAADAGIITATLPAVAALLSVAAGDRLSRLQSGAVALAVGGLVLVHAGGAAAGTSLLFDNLLIGVAVLCEASFVLLGKRLAPPFRPLRLALGANVVGLVLALPLALVELPSFDPGAISGEMWVLGTWYALAASVICLWLWYRALPYVETWLAGLTAAAIPVAALALSALYLGETIGGIRPAAAIILGAMAPDSRRTPPPA